MEYTYATLLLNETNREINERNLTSVLEAASVDVSESRAKAFVAAMEDVDLDETVGTPDASRVAADATSDDSDGEAMEPADDPEEGTPEPAVGTGDDIPGDGEAVGTAGATTDDETVAPLDTGDEPEGS